MIQFNAIEGFISNDQSLPGIWLLANMKDVPKAVHSASTRKRIYDSLCYYFLWQEAQKLR